jgi:hypothetical protein
MLARFNTIIVRETEGQKKETECKERARRMENINTEIRIKRYREATDNLALKMSKDSVRQPPENRLNRLSALSRF